ncbi:MAG: AMP-binding protein [Woeseiaceae bacterium]
MIPEPIPGTLACNTLFHPFVGQDVPRLLKARAEDRADHHFLIWAPFDGDEQRWTYGAFYQEVCRLAAGMRAKGVSRGDMVLLHMENCPEFLLTWHACSRLGAIVVTTNTRSSEDEMQYFLEDCGASVAITQPKFESMVRNAGPRLKWLAVTETDLGATPDTPRSGQALPFEDLRGDIEDAPLLDAEPLSVNSIQYTSGTTSRPKGVLWTHANALWGAQMNARHTTLRPDDVGHVCLPLYHTNALCYSHLATLWVGATMVLQPKFSASRYWKVCAEHHCTYGVQIPFMLFALMKHPVPEQHDFRLWGLGAENPGIISDTFRIPCLGWFGMTETISLPIISSVHLAGQEMSMGRPAPEYDIQVRREDGSHVDIGESGALWIRGIPGLSLFAGYLHKPEATAEAFDADGWFDTGDRVTPNDDGTITFNGRDRDTMRVGAENVAESEVERVVQGVPVVTEVAVVGKPDPMLGDVPVAFVQTIMPTPGIEEMVIAACREKLADFKVPVEVRVVDDFPRVTLGKIDKKLLRKTLADEVGEFPSS